MGFSAAALLLDYKCRLLITFANSLDPDQARQNVGPDLDPKLFDTLMVFPKEFFKKVDFEKNQQTTKNMQHYTVGREVIQQGIVTSNKQRKITFL